MGILIKFTRIKLGLPSVKMIPCLVVGLILGGCGPQSASESRPAIYGGTLVPAGTWDEVVALVGRQDAASEWRLICTGTLVAPQTILTAGHCIEGLASGPAQDLLGVAWGTGAEGGVFRDIIPVASVARYPFFREHPLGSADIGLVFTGRAIPGMTPMRLVTTLAEALPLWRAGRTTLVGYGRREDGGLGRKVQVETQVRKVTPLEAYAGGGGRDACDGDSGGPALAQLPDSTWRQVGVVARGANFDCGTGGYLTITNQVACWIKGQVTTQYGPSAFSEAVDACHGEDAPPDRTVDLPDVPFGELCRGVEGSPRQQENARNMALFLAQGDCLLAAEALRRDPEIDLTGAMLDDLTPLAGETATTTLRLGGNFITDLRPLLSLPALARVYLEANQVQDETVIRALEARGVRVFGRKRQLGFFDQTTFLRLCQSPTTGPSARRTIQVILWKTLAEDCVTANQRLLASKKLSLRERQLTDLAPLAGLEHLEELDLRDNPLVDLSPLTELESLRLLDLRGTQARNLDPLRGLMAAGLVVKGPGESDGR